MNRELASRVRTCRPMAQHGSGRRHFLLCSCLTLFGPSCIIAGPKILMGPSGSIYVAERQLGPAIGRVPGLIVKADYRKRKSGTMDLATVDTILAGKGGEPKF